MGKVWMLVFGIFSWVAWGAGLAEAGGIIGGNANNSITPGVLGGTISGGGGNTETNRVTDDFGTVGGGLFNRAGDNAGNTVDAPHATVGGGDTNVASGPQSTVGGGVGNVASGERATVCGGDGNVASDFRSTVGGGASHVASGEQSTIAGGGNNDANALRATVGGGGNNDANDENSTIGGGFGNSANGPAATVCGGEGNVAGLNIPTVVVTTWATVGGGFQNTATGTASVVPGGENNEATGSFSFAAGRRAKATTGAFLWADSTDADFDSAAANEFAARASGGFRFRTSSDLLTGCNLPAGSGTFSCSSSREVKEGFEAVNGRDVLSQLVEMPIGRWRFAGEGEETAHLGPVAEDFRAAFGLGQDDRTISHIDADGVAMAAIQGLFEIVKEKDAEIAALREVVDTMKTAMVAQEARLRAVATSIDRLAPVEASVKGRPIDSASSAIQ